MKVLFVTNYYPPCGFGGYEEMCRELAVRLRGRGHEVWVLTSRQGGTARADRNGGVERSLHLRIAHRPLINALRTFAAPLLESRNRALVTNALRKHGFDLVVVWGMWNLGKELARHIEIESRDRTVFYVADYWPILPDEVRTYWESPGRGALARPLKRALGALAGNLRGVGEVPRLKDAIFPSHFVRDELARHYGATGDWLVLPGIADLRRLLAVPAPHRRPRGGATWELAFAGRLSPDKGVDTAIRAFGLLCSRRTGVDLRLTIAGEGDSSYTEELRSVARELGVAERVRFVGWIDGDAMRELYASTDIQLFPSVWDEPFGRVVVEAMAAGAAVVGTATGGAAEILDDGRNGLVHRPGDVEGLAGAVEALLSDEDLHLRLVAAARKDAVERWNLDVNLNQIERLLERVADRDDHVA